MVKIFLNIRNSLAQPLEDWFCEMNRCSWGVEKINEKTPTELFGYFDSEADARAAFAEVRAAFPEVGENFSVESVDDLDWKNEYKKFLKPWSFENLHWIPVWMRSEVPVPAGDKALYFDAGLAFGTGDHPTTRLCAMSMLDYVKLNGASGKFLIDAGCGSGILALSAALVGFEKVYGFDRDEEAVSVSRENAAFNGISSGVEFEHAGIEKALAGKTADVVLANIISDVLCIYADNLIGAVRDGGWLVLSGILSAENDKVREHFLARAGGRVAACSSLDMGDWSRLEIRMK